MHAACFTKTTDSTLLAWKSILKVRALQVNDFTSHSDPPLTLANKNEQENFLPKTR